MNKPKFSRYNDGVVSIYREKSNRTDFGAKQNVSSRDKLDFIVKLDYEESTRREEDMDFANQMGFSLSLKVRTRFFKEVKSEYKAVIDNYLYDIKYLDKTRDEMWLYLEGIRGLDEC